MAREGLRERERPGDRERLEGSGREARRRETLLRLEAAAGRRRDSEKEREPLQQSGVRRKLRNFWCLCIFALFS